MDQSSEQPAQLLEERTGPDERPVPSVTTGVPPGARIVSVDLPIEQLECAACGQRVAQALVVVPGVVRAFVNPETRRATVVYDQETTGLPAMAEAVKRAGYQIGSAQERIGIQGMT